MIRREEPAFIFAFLMVQWYDSKTKKDVSITYDFVKRGWYDGKGMLIICTTLEKDTKVDVLWSIKNAGRDSGLPVFKLVDVSLVTGGDVLLRVQRNAGLPTGSIWSDRSNFKYSGEKCKLEFFACARIAGDDYTRDTIGPPYLQLWPKA